MPWKFSPLRVQNKEFIGKTSQELGAQSHALRQLIHDIKSQQRHSHFTDRHSFQSGAPPGRASFDSLKASTADRFRERERQDLAEKTPIKESPLKRLRNDTYNKMQTELNQL